MNGLTEADVRRIVREESVVSVDLRNASLEFAHLALQRQRRLDHRSGEQEAVRHVGRLLLRAPGRGGP